jgi:hypothetical protein
METIVIDDYHSIEFKISSWDENEISIRNRYNQDNGRFDRSSSSELSFADLHRLTIETLKRDYFNEQECIELLKEIAATLDRKIKKNSP